MRAEQLTAPCTTHGEGPVWDSGADRLRWVDMLDGDVLTLDPAGSIERLHVSGMVTALRPRAGGGLVVAVERGFAVLDPGGQIVTERTAFDDPGCRMNDGGTDRQGRFFCGSMDYDMTAPRGALYRYDPDGTISTVLTGVILSNGIAWSLDGERMYYIDSVTQRVDVFDYDIAAGTPGGRQALVRIDAASGLPDGMALDSEGGIWVALYGGHAVHRYRSDGKLDVVVELPGRPGHCVRVRRTGSRRAVHHHLPGRPRARFPARGRRGVCGPPGCARPSLRRLRGLEHGALRSATRSA